MPLLAKIYKLLNNSTLRGGGEVPYYYNYSLWTIITKPIRKWFSTVLVPIIPFSNLRVACYRLCGYKIGKGTFIGMRCYLDDMCYDKITIGSNVTISYGVFFACHGRKQGHNTLVIEDGAYIGMNSSVLARRDLRIGRDAVVGACTLVTRDVPDGATSVGIPNRILPTGEEKS